MRRMLDILVLFAVLWVVLWLAVIAHAFQEPEGAMGTFPLPAVLTQMGPQPFSTSQEALAHTTGTVGYVLASGKLDAALHESQEGYFNVGKFSISVPPKGIPADVLREHLNAEIELVIRRKQPKVLSEVGR